MTDTHALKLIGVIGNPISHSKSPIMHNTVLKACKINATYLPLLVEEKNLKNALDGVRGLNFLGVNVTIPYKTAVMAHLDERYETATYCGAVNTIVNKNGKLIGHNTDGEGFLKAYPIGYENKTVAILGAGGSSKAIASSLITKKIKKLILVNRSLEKPNAIKEHLKTLGYNCVELHNLDHPSVLNEADVVVQTTPVGMHPETDATPIHDFSWVRHDQEIIDIIYNPDTTAFLHEVKKKGANIHLGKRMLAGQAALAFTLFTGKQVDLRAFIELL